MKVGSEFIGEIVTAGMQSQTGDFGTVDVSVGEMRTVGIRDKYVMV